MTKTLVAALLSLGIASAQPALAPPRLGFIQDATHGLRPVYGVAGNFVLGPPIVANVVSAAFGGSFGLLKTAAALAAFDATGKLLASFDTAPGPALFAFSPDGTRALAYIPAAHLLFESDGNSFQPIPLSSQQASGVLAIAFPTASEATLLLQRRAAVWQVYLPLDAERTASQTLDAVGTASQCAVMGVRAPLLVLPSGDLVYRGEDGIAIRRKDGSEVHLPASLPAHFSLQQMSRDWVELTDLSASVRFTIRTTRSSEALYRLPE